MPVSGRMVGCLKIIDGNIFQKRGDTAEFDINLTVDGRAPDRYEAVFSVKKSLSDRSYLFQKNVENGHVRIKHGDTQALPYGKYYYDIQIRIDDGSEEGLYTTVGPYEYNLKPDVTTG